MKQASIEAGCLIRKPNYKTLFLLLRLRRLERTQISKQANILKHTKAQISTQISKQPYITLLDYITLLHYITLHRLYY